MGVELNADEHISFLKSLLNANDDSFSGRVMIRCDLFLFRDSMMIKLSYTYAYQPYMKFHTTWS